jgi:hypothetical protein
LLSCFTRHFIGYTHKRISHVKYDGVTQPLIECVASILFKVRQVYLSTNDRDNILSGLSLIPRQISNQHQITIDDLTIEQWLVHILTSLPSIKTIRSLFDEQYSSNWNDLQIQLGLPSLKPIYFFIINILLDVQYESLNIDKKSRMIWHEMEINSNFRQQVQKHAFHR